jgi:ankyrin repeat protein
MSTFHDAARSGDLKILRQLLTTGVDPNQSGEGGMTPLHYAASAGHYEAGQLLLENGADIDSRDAEGATPLYFAAYFGKTEMAVVLLNHGVNPNAGNQANYTPCIWQPNGDICPSSRFFLPTVPIQKSRPGTVTPHCLMRSTAVTTMWCP